MNFLVYDVILPMVVLRRLDALLEPTKDSVMKELPCQRDEVMAKLRLSELDLYRLIAKDDAVKIAMQNTLKRILIAS